MISEISGQSCNEFIVDQSRVRHPRKTTPPTSLSSFAWAYGMYICAAASRQRPPHEWYGLGVSATASAPPLQGKGSKFLSASRADHRGGAGPRSALRIQWFRGRWGLIHGERNFGPYPCRGGRAPARPYPCRGGGGWWPAAIHIYIYISQDQA